MKILTNLLKWLCIFAMLGGIIYLAANDGCGKKKAARNEAKGEASNLRIVKDIQYILKHDTTILYKNAKGITHSLKQVVVGNDAQLDMFLAKQLDSVRNELNLTKRQLREVLQANIDINGIWGGNLILVEKGVYRSDFSDCFIKETHITNINDMHDSVNYHADIELHGVQYIKNKHNFLFLHWGKISIEDNFWTNCPNVVVSSIKDIKIQRK